MSTKRSSGCFRGYSNEQKTLRAKLDHLIKWTRDLKSNLMKQSCKILQTNTDINREIIDQIHDDLDEYKRKLDRELGRIHDICDALNNNPGKTGDEENLRDEILEALRRSPTYSSLEQHIDGDSRLHIRVKSRENIRPRQKCRPASTDIIKRKVSQPIALHLLDTSSIPGTKRRSQVDAFKRSRSFTNVEHTETQLGMDYVEEDESELSWKPFGPKRPVPQVDERPSTNLPVTTDQPKEKPKPSSIDEDNSSDEEFDVAWERHAKQKARKEAANAPPPPTPPVGSPRKRTVRFSTSTADPTDLIELDFDETTQHSLPQSKDQNNNSDRQQTEVVQLDDDDDDTITSIPQQDDSSRTINGSDDEIIALSDDEIPKPSTIIRKRPSWTTSTIQITNENSQSQSSYNPYRVGIADPSLRSVFLPPPPPNSQTMSGSNNTNRRTQGGNRKGASNKRRI